MTSFSLYTTHKHGVAMGKVAIVWGQDIVWFSWCSGLRCPSSDIVLPNHYMDNIYSGASALHMGGKTPPPPPNLLPMIVARLTTFHHIHQPRFSVILDSPLHYVTDSEQCQINRRYTHVLSQGATHECQVEGLYFVLFFHFRGHLRVWLPLFARGIPNIPPTINTTDRYIPHSVYLAVASLQCVPV